jgi:hypothetical protein
VFRGFTAGELAAHVRAAVPAARGLAVRHRLGWRVVASWHPAPLPAAAHGAAAREAWRHGAVAAPPAAPLDRASALLR